LLKARIEQAAGPQRSLVVFFYDWRKWDGSERLEEKGGGRRERWKRE
jgi:hypothetical protein